MLTFAIKKKIPILVIFFNQKPNDKVLAHHIGMYTKHLMTVLALYTYSQHPFQCNERTRDLCHFLFALLRPEI